MIVVTNKKKFTLFILIVALIAGIFLFQPVLKMFFPLEFDSYIEKYASRYSLDKYLVMGVISAESNFDKDAVSHKSAYGLMQIREDTANWCIDRFDLEVTFEDILEPETNIEIGCAYLNYLIDIFDGEVKTALAAYNAGDGNVRKWLKDESYSSDGKTLHTIPFEETDKYVGKVINRMETYQRLYHGRK